MLSENLYPTVKEKDSKFGSQTFADPNYVPASLDSEEAALVRMLTALDEGLSDEAVKAAGLNGSDEVCTVENLFAEVANEAAALRACGDDATAIRATASLLDGERWVAAVAAAKAAVPEVVELP